MDTACLRQLDTNISFTQGQETYVLSAIASKGVLAQDVLNVTVIWGQTRIPLMNTSFTLFNGYFRTWVTNQSRPAVFAKQGTGPLMTLFIQPVPDQTYTVELDYLYLPTVLVDNTTVDQLVYPYTDPVPYYAAHKAKFKTQSYGEAASYMQEYRVSAAWAISVGYTRVLPNVYNGDGAIF